MFLNKKLKTTFLFFTFSFIVSNIFAESAKFISSLTLDFSREEILDEQSDNKNILTGKIYYVKNPFLFIFETIKPVPQVTFVNDTSAFLIQNNDVFEIPENKEVLYQTCNDFLTWFDNDFGLSEESFKPVPVDQSIVENDQIITVWYYTQKDIHPIEKINVFTSKNGVITRLQMYTDAKTLITDTKLEDFEYSVGNVYPTKIISTTYSSIQSSEPDNGDRFITNADNGDRFITNNGDRLITTILSFSNVQFNSSIDFPYEVLQSEYQINQLPAKLNDKSIYLKTETTISQTDEKFNVSVPEVLLQGSYAFYKKFITNQDMTNCPYYPSCSQYMVQAVSQNGFVGFFQGLERLKRCTSTEHKRNLYPTLPNGKHYDPVPEKKRKKDTK